MATLVPTEIFVDPSIAGDSGTGTVGDPYGDLEFAIVQETFDLTNGTRLNIKAGTAEVLIADLSVSFDDTSVSIAWNPTFTAPLFIQGYTTAADDGGIGEIDGGGSIPIINDITLDHVILRDLKAGNCGINAVFNVNNKWMILNCELHTSTGLGNSVDADPIVIGNYFHSTNTCFQTTGPGLVWGNIAANSALRCYDHNQDVVSMFNIAHTGAASASGVMVGETAYGINSSVYGAGGTGNGMESRIQLANGTTLAMIDNVVSGLSGVGGVGVNDNVLDPTYNNVRGSNSVFNCETEIVDPAAAGLINFGNESLGAEPFTDAPSLDFSPTGVTADTAVAFFSGFNAANVWAVVRGAVQPSAAAPSGNQLALHIGAVQPA